jgi:hypothetical protein
MTEYKTTKKVDLTKIARMNAMNKTGWLDYNRFGVKDGQGFQACSDRFVDNFLLRVVVPDYQWKKKVYIHLGSLNKSIQEKLRAFGLTSFKLKGVNGHYEVKEKITDKMKDVRERDPAKETPDTQYYWQDVKVSCANEKAEDVLTFLREGNYRTMKAQLKDIDFTLDFAGSFDKEEVISYMTEKEDFRMQGDTENPFGRTIIDNDHTVGRNCLSYMDTSPAGCSVRCKLYNKMVQCLEVKAVGDKLGNHWKNWVDQRIRDKITNEKVPTRLAIAKDKATARGLTRAEVTFNCKEDIPSDKDMDIVLQQITAFVPSFLVYSTPYSATWKAYCDSFIHSLVVVGRGEEKENAVIVHSYNQLTGVLSGMEINHWEKDWCMANLTLSVDLPIDLIEVNLVKKDEEKKEWIYCLTMSRWMKQHPNGEPFTTRLVCGGSMYSYGDHTQEKCEELLVNSGFLPHKNCIPHLSHKRCNRSSKAPIQLKYLESLRPKIIHRMKKERAETVISALDLVKQETLDRMENIRDTTTMHVMHANIKKAYTETYKYMLKKLKDLKEGDYDILALKAVKSNGKFGVKYIMLLEREGLSMQAYSNWKIEDTVQRLLPVHIMELLAKENIVHSKHDGDGPIGKMTVTGYGVSKDGNKFAHCRFMFLAHMQAWISETRQRLQQSHMMGTPANLVEIHDTDKVGGETSVDDDGQAMCSPMENNVAITQGIPGEAEVRENQSNVQVNDLPIVPPEELPLFKDILDLILLPAKSIHTLKKIGFIARYGQNRLLVQLEDGVRYVAGKDLESKQDKLHVDCKLVLEKTKLCTSTRKKHYIVNVVRKGDWAGIIQYSDTPIIKQRKGNEATTRVLDVSNVEHKGQKRKLVLTDDGNVYRVKASRLEKEITAGWFV